MLQSLLAFDSDWKWVSFWEASRSLIGPKHTLILPQLFFVSAAGGAGVMGSAVFESVLCPCVGVIRSYKVKCSHFNLTGKSNNII